MSVSASYAQLSQRFANATQDAARLGERAGAMPRSGSRQEANARCAEAGWSARNADLLLRALAAARHSRVVLVAEAAYEFDRRQAWFRFGFARRADFAREILGISGRWLGDHAALGDLFHQFPALKTAVRGAREAAPLGRVAALEIGRVATEATLPYWIDRARKLNVTQLIELVREARRASARDSVSHTAATDGSDRRASDGSGSKDRNCDRGVAASCDDRRRVAGVVPASVRVAFDESLDLHRAVVGTHASVEEFIVALGAEFGASAAEGGEPESEHSGHEYSTLGLSPGDRESHQRESLRQLRGGRGVRSATDEDLAMIVASTSRSTSAMGAAAKALLQLDSCEGVDVARRSSSELAELLRRLVDLENAIQLHLGDLLAELETQTLRHLGVRTVVDYARENLGMAATTTRQALRLSRALRENPAVRTAYQCGEIGQAAALAIARTFPNRTLDREAQQRWVAAARDRTAKRLTDELECIQKRRLEERQTRLRSALASARQALAPGRKDPNAQAPGVVELSRLDAHVSLQPLTDEDWMASLHRKLGQTRERVLELGYQALDLTVLRGASLDRAATDVVLQFHLAAEVAECLSGAIRGAIDCLVRAASTPTSSAHQARERPSLRVAREYLSRGAFVPWWVGLLALLEEYVLTWDDPRRMGKRRLLDDICNRDGWRCAAPGCSSRRNLEVHHIVYRARGGDDGPANLVTLCRFHHQRGEHGDEARVRGRAPLALRWRLGRRELATWYQNERRV